MGFWGIGISENDTFSDVYDDFSQYYNDGVDVIEISEKLFFEYKEVINNEDDFTNFWFALAKAQWECKALDEKVLNKISWIINENIDIEIWRNLDASESDLRKRKKVLNRFIENLRTEKEKPKVRKKLKTISSAFRKGDCLIFKLQNENYGSAIVLEAENEEDLNLIAFTRINQKEKPNIGNILESEILIKNFGKWKPEYFIDWFFQDGFQKIKSFFENIGSIEVTIQYDTKNNPLNFQFSNFHEELFQTINDCFEMENKNIMPLNLRKLKDLI